VRPHALEPEDAHRFAVTVAQSLAASGKSHEALERIDAAERHIQSTQLHRRVEMEKVRSLVGYFSGDFALGKEAGERHIALARQAGLAYEVAVGTHNLGDTLLRLGELDRAVEVLSESLEVARANGLHRLHAHNEALLAYAKSSQDPARAIAEMRAFIGLAESRKYLWDALNGRFYLCKLLVRTGSPDARAELVATIDREERLDHRLIATETRKLLAALDMGAEP